MSPSQSTPHDPRADLDLDVETMASLGRDLLDRIVAHLGDLSSMPAAGTIDRDRIDEACRALPREAPETPQPWGELLDRYFAEYLPPSYLTPGPGYLAYVPGGGLFVGALATFLAAATNRYTGVWAAAPLLTELEGRVLDWLREWMGFPASAGGLLTEGGSASNQTAITVARERRLGADHRPGTMYVSDQVHHCVVKSARLAGIHPDRVRILPVDARAQMRTDSLEEAVAADRARGLRPFLVVSSAGTTNTGAIDPLPEIGALARREGLWHHVDGAYGACFHLVESMRPGLAGMSDADSLTLDPHKGLFLPLGHGALLVREAADLRRVHEMTAGYLPPLPAPEFHDPSRVGPELSRSYRGLPLWLAVQVHGVAAIRAAVAEKRELAVWAAERLRETPGIELFGDPPLSLVAFRAARADASPEVCDALTRSVVEEVNRRQRVFISGATLGERWIGRICVMSFRTRSRHVEFAVEDIAAARAALD